MLQQENGKDTGVDPACKGGHDTDDTKTIAGLKEKVAFLEKKLQIVGSVTRHDVLNQLTAIVGYNELLGMMVEDPKFRSFLEKEKFALDKIRRQFQFAKDYQNIAVDPPRWQNIRNLASRVSEDFDLKEVRILTVETGDHAVPSDAAEKRRADVQKAEAQSEITNQMIFATASGSKWGDYDVDVEKLMKDADQPEPERKESEKNDPDKNGPAENES